MTRRGVERGRRNLLDFKRDDVAMAGELGGGVRIIEASGDNPIGDRAGRAVGVGIEYVNVVAECARSHRGHATELTAAKNSNCRAGTNDAGHVPEMVRLASTSF